MATAQGSVAYADSLKPAAGATVKAVKDQKVETSVADDSGEFTFDDLEAGEWAFTAAQAGYRALWDGETGSQPVGGEDQPVSDRAGQRQRTGGRAEIL